jgi:uncharacterized OB-fold protein
MRNPIDDSYVFELYPDIQLTRDNIEHYRALAERRLVINHCSDCGYWIYPHRPLCPECWSWNVRPEEIGGFGAVFMFTLLHQLRDSKNLIHPINVAAVELDEQRGLRYLARVVNCAPQEISHGMRVQLTWIEIDGKEWPAFEPIRTGKG